MSQHGFMHVLSYNFGKQRRIVLVQLSMFNHELTTGWIDEGVIPAEYHANDPRQTPSDSAYYAFQRRPIFLEIIWMPMHGS